MFGAESAEKDEELYFSDDSDIVGDDFEKKKKSSPPLGMSDSEDEIEEASQILPSSIKKTKGKKEATTNKALTTGKKKVCLNFKIKFHL